MPLDAVAGRAEPHIQLLARHRQIVGGMDWDRAHVNTAEITEKTCRSGVFQFMLHFHAHFTPRPHKVAIGGRRRPRTESTYRQRSSVSATLAPASRQAAGSRPGGSMEDTRRLWIGLAVLLASSFAVLLWMGGSIYRNAPPMPDQVVAGDGSVIYTRADIERGRQVWQSIGGMQLGSIWGHGGYVAPDWSADWLHREASRFSTFGRIAKRARRASTSSVKSSRRRSADGWRRACGRTRTTREPARSRSTPTARSQSSGSRRITRACSATSRRRPRCAKRTR